MPFYSILKRFPMLALVTLLPSFIISGQTSLGRIRQLGQDAYQQLPPRSGSRMSTTTSDLPFQPSGFSRQAFLSAFQERIRTERELMGSERGPGSALVWNTKSAPWQNNFVTLPSMPPPFSGQTANFEIALAYLSSEELRIPFASRNGDALITLVGVDSNNLYVRPNALFHQFESFLLQSVLDGRRACSLERGPYRSDADELGFANSLCSDMKRAVGEARSEFQQAELLANTKRLADGELQKTQALLKQAPEFDKPAQIELARKSLELAIAGSNTGEIQEKTKILSMLNGEINGYIRTQQVAAEAKRQQENQTRLFVAAQQRGEEALKAATASMNTASKWSGDKLVALPLDQTSHTLKLLSAKLRSLNPNDEPEISALTDTLLTQSKDLKAASHESQTLQGRVGQRVYNGCVAWVEKQTGQLPAVKVFKNDQTNVDTGQYTTEQVCRCLAVRVTDEKEVTDEFKLEVGRQLATTDRLANPQMKMAAFEFAGCYADLVNQRVFNK